MNILAISALYLSGKMKKKYLLISNIITLANQFIWLWYCIYTEQYGLLPTTICFFFISLNNIRKIYKSIRDDKNKYMDREQKVIG